MNKLVVAVAIAIAAGTSYADDIALPKTNVVLHLDAGWHSLGSEGVAVAYRDGAGNLLAVTRADVPNPDAWRAKTKQAYAEQIENGVKMHVPGYRRIAKKLGEANGVPVLDLEARRKDGATIVIRVLLFRTYALALAIETKASDAAFARAIATRFAPPTPIE